MNAPARGGLRPLVLIAALVAVAAVAVIAFQAARDTVPTPVSSGTVPAPLPEGPASAAPGVVVTSFPGLPTPTGDPVLDGTADAAPSRLGTVGRIAGPFDDRFVWKGVRLSGGTVTGAVDVTSDVSDLLELQVQAGFYDRAGRLLGIARFTHHLDESTHHDDGPPSEFERFRIAAPASYRAKVASAAVGVPVLVNE